MVCFVDLMTLFHASLSCTFLTVPSHSIGTEYTSTASVLTDMTYLSQVECSPRLHEDSLSGTFGVLVKSTCIAWFVRKLRGKMLWAVHRPYPAEGQIWLAVANSNHFWLQPLPGIVRRTIGDGSKLGNQRPDRVLRLASSKTIEVGLRLSQA